LKLIMMLPIETSANVKANAWPENIARDQRLQHASRNLLPMVGNLDDVHA
jgi:hypothetical protein